MSSFYAITGRAMKITSNKIQCRRNALFVSPMRGGCP